MCISDEWTATVTCTLSLITFIEHRERARAFAVYAAVSGGGALTEYLSWRWTLLVNTPIAIIG